MKKSLVLGSLLLALMAFPAKADTQIYLGYHGPAHGWQRHGDVRFYRASPIGHRRVERHHKRHAFPIVFRDYHPVRTRVIERTVIQPVYYEPAPLVATPVSADYINVSGRLCRAYQATASIGGMAEDIYGTACLQPDGAWRVIE